MAGQTSLGGSVMILDSAPDGGIYRLNEDALEYGDPVFGASFMKDPLSIMSTMMRKKRSQASKNWGIVIVLETFNNGQVARYVPVVPLEPSSTNPVLHIPLASPRFAPLSIFQRPLTLTNAWPDCLLLRHRSCVRFDRVFERPLAHLTPLCQPSIEEHNESASTTAKQLKLTGAGLSELQWHMKRRAERQEASAEAAMQGLDLSLLSGEARLHRVGSSGTTSSNPFGHASFISDDTMSIASSSTSGGQQRGQHQHQTLPRSSASSLWRDRFAPRTSYDASRPISTSTSSSIHTTSADPGISPFTLPGENDDGSTTTTTTTTPVSSRPGTSGQHHGAPNSTSSTAPSDQQWGAGFGFGLQLFGGKRKNSSSTKRSSLSSSTNLSKDEPPSGLNAGPGANLNADTNASVTSSRAKGKAKENNEWTWRPGSALGAGTPTGGLVGAPGSHQSGAATNLREQRRASATSTSTGMMSFISKTSQQGLMGGGGGSGEFGYAGGSDDGREVELQPWKGNKGRYWLSSASDQDGSI